MSRTGRAPGVKTLSEAFARGQPKAASLGLDLHFIRLSQPKNNIKTCFSGTYDHFQDIETCQAAP